MKKNNSILRYIGFIIPLYLLFNSYNITAQTPGVIFQGTPNTVLDPNGDGYVSLPPSETPSQYTNIGFPSNINDTDVFDVLYSEIAYAGIPEITPEPTSDLNKGPSCAFTDLVQDANSRSSYYNTDGTNMRFRFRLGGAASNSKGYSILIDTDEKFGFTGPNKDPNAVVGNPGFEVEIVLRTNFTVDAYSIDGTTNPTIITTQPYTTHAIKSLALTTVCDDPDYFYDFYLSFSDLTGYINNATKLRMISVTSINPKGIMGNNGTSDVAGVDDSSNTTDNLYEEAIDTQTPTNGDPLERAACPLINGTIPTGSSVPITGTTNAVAAGEETEIEVFVNGASVGTSTTSTTTWGFTIPGPINEEDKITATATVKKSTEIIKGTSVANCDTKTVTDTSCIPLATPVFVNFANGGKTLTLTYPIGEVPVGTSFFLNFYDSSTGTKITTIDGTNVQNYASSSPTSIGLGGGNKFTDDSVNFFVTIDTVSDTNPASCPSLGSEPISTCSSGTVSATPFLDPFELGDTSITGNFGGIPPTSATLRLIINGSSTDYITTTTGSSNTFSIDITGLTLLTTDAIKVSNRNFGTACLSTPSAVVSPIITSLTPIIDVDFCTTTNISTVSGTSSELGGTIRVYSGPNQGISKLSALDTNTATVLSNGTWSLTLAASITPGNWIGATVQNTNEIESDISDDVQINTKTVATSLVITSDPIKEGDISIIGTSSGLATGSIIQLYLDGSLIDGKFTTTDGAGNWTINDLDNSSLGSSSFDELYSDAVVTVTATSTAAGSCESDQSSSKVVICNPPTVPTISTTSSPICENGIFMVTVTDAQPGLLYQLLDQDNNSVGPSFLGPNIAADKIIDSDPLPFGTNSLKVRASKIFGTCTSVESNSVSVTVYPSPTITFGPNPSATFDNSTANQQLVVTFSSAANQPSLYSIDFDDAANAASLLDVSSTALSGSQIDIDIPTGLPIGVYNGSITIQEVLVNSCSKSYPITITILAPSAPTFTNLIENENICAGTTLVNFTYDGTTNAPTNYSIDFSDAANLQGFTDLVDVDATFSGSGSITVAVPTNPAEGTYTGVIRLKNTTTGFISQEYPIEIEIEKTTAGVIAGNQIILSTTDVVAFTSTEDASGLGGVTYQWQKSTTSATIGFSNISGATSATFNEGTITQATYYKRIATSVTNSCTAESNVITVTILTLSGIPMITQVYQFGNEKWIEITNISSNTINANEIKVILFKDKIRDQTDKLPDATYSVTSVLAPGQSVLIKNTLSTNITNINGAPLIDDNLTDIDGGNDMISLSTTTDATAWANRYDIVANIPNKTSLVRIDETFTPNTTYTASEWVVFIDDTLDPYRLLAAGGAQRHPHDPLISEIESANTDANTLLGLHRVDITTRNGAAWDNGYPDRSRFVVIDENYNHTTARLSARKLTVDASKKLSVTDNLLAVTNTIVLNGDIRLIGTSQLIQTHTTASLVTGTGQLLVDQNSTVPSIYRYNYMGSPVINTAGASNYTVATIFKDGTTPTNHTGVVNTDIAKDINWISGYNGDTSDPISLAQYWIYTYAANAGTRASWSQKLSSGTIPNTDGFIFKGPGRPQNYTFVGIPKDGEITTAIGGNESYLVGNPFASALSVKEFIEDNKSSTSGVLYFWEHASEKTTSESSSIGHNFAGYIGGYATRTIAMGVTAKDATGAVDVIIESEDSSVTINGTSEEQTENSLPINVVKLETIANFIKFSTISKGADTLRIKYKSEIDKSIIIKVNDIDRLEVTLPVSVGTSYAIFEVALCVEAGNNITLQSNDTNIAFIDYLNLIDADGQLTCAPSTGGSAITYTEPEPYVAIGQGFFIQGDIDGGAVVFNNSQREYKLEEAGSSVFFKSATKSKSDSNSLLNTPAIKLGMNFKSTDDNKEYHRQIGVSFSQYTSFNYDKGYDAEMYDLGNTDIYWKFPNDNRNYIISGVQQISDDLEVPLEITMGYSGDINITIDEMKNINENVYIRDKVADISYDIKNGKANITLDKGTYSDRFVLAFVENKVLGTEDENLIKDITIFTDKTSQNLIISKNEEITIKKVVLYTILGKKVGLWNINEQTQKTALPFNKKLSTGLYIVKMKTANGNISKKIIIQ
ncbi:hypothetical protein BTO04_01450 [Polaribacter sp. SA4-10]|uniref:T9SS type A sorting domain-containing protein n=1 Tax=Polaribacter sp. SA4-10 TaxID=754397 RepID=UPI000B3CCDE9|nr:T9SS type A sorting domain-containing protein [Polaribacter sp. SA4-10]ARV05438.1 hypothetical protein BTO04_01450 [Polaribacter sp. SA4-10]